MLPLTVAVCARSVVTSLNLLGDELARLQKETKSAYGSALDSALKKTLLLRLDAGRRLVSLFEFELQRNVTDASTSVYGAVETVLLVALEKTFKSKVRCFSVRKSVQDPDFLV